MDEFDATSIVFNRIKSIDPDNASKIMGYILIQDVKERDLLCLASCPETLLQALIFRAKSHLGFSSNTTLSTPTSPSPNPFSRFNSSSNNHVSRNPFVQMSPRLTTNNGYLEFGKNSPLSDPKSSPFLSFENIRSGPCLVPSVVKNNFVVGDSGHGSGNSGNDYMEELQFNDFLSFLDESSKNEDFIDPKSQFNNWCEDVNNGGDIHLQHRRSFSASDACFGTADASFSLGYRPCLYFARGFCKNGDSCKFVHGGFGDNVDVNGVVVGSPNKMDGLYLQQHEEMMRMKAAAHQQRLAASQFAADGSPPLPYDKCMDFLLQQQNDPQRAAAAALMLGDEFYKFGQGQAERNDFLAMGEKMNSANRQIYLTFPADSTFKDEDVSNYFSNFGPLQDVRIPYQQKRMFGFVTFVYSETVKLILARGNPHFICDSRVLVKPYKEKGKILEERQQQYERGNMSPCSSPSDVDSRDPYDLHLGAKMLCHTQELMLRKKLEEQAELHQAIEFQRRRLMNLQLPNLKNHSIHHYQRSLSASPARTDANQNVIFPSSGINQEVSEVDYSTVNNSSNVTAAAEQESQTELNAACFLNNGSNNTKEESFKTEGIRENGAEILPHNLFASMRKPVEGQSPDLSASSQVNGSTAISATPSVSENNADMPYHLCY